MFVYTVEIEMAVIDGFGELHRYNHLQICKNKEIAKREIKKQLKYNLIYFRDVITNVVNYDVTDKIFVKYLDSISGVNMESYPFPYLLDGFALTINSDANEYKFKLWNKGNYGSAHLVARILKLEVLEE